jgi:hypothetical protein
MSEPSSHAPAPDAERIRAALIRAAVDGYEQATLSGLCSEGAWEAAISAMRRLDLGELARSERGGESSARSRTT